MKLHTDWQLILRKAWSIKLAALGILFAVGDVVLPLFGDAISRNTFALLVGANAAGTLISRLISQDGFGDKS
jgi:hypothetical protein